jgi:polyferredoxin
MKNKIRLWFQLIIFGLLGYLVVRPIIDKSYFADFEAYCPFGGIASLMSKLNMGNMSCQMSEVQVLLGIGLIVGAIFFGKLFCSFLCPIGSITEWLGKIGDKFKVRIEMPNILDRILRSLKYVLLFLTVYYTMTASELFCKTYDPYFAVATLFGDGDILLYYAIPALIITILGAIFFRLFWCKYLCPLGAVTNIFYNVLAVGGVIILYIILNAAGMELSLIWLVAGIVLVGLITEVGFKRSLFLPITKIVRNTDTCTDCGICEDKCPQGIELMKYKKINHIDCNLCSDCVFSCPVKQSLKINNKKTTKYLAPVVTVILIAISLGFSSSVEFTTISERWGGFENLKTVENYKQTGLKNVKCFSSAISLKRQIEDVKGIYGIDAYASSHSVEIYYNPEEITARNVKASIFKPAKQKVRLIKSELDSLTQWEVAIDRLFDNVDFINLVYALRNDEGVYGFETHFGEPVLATIFYDESLTDPQKMTMTILTKEIDVKLRDGGIEKRELEFKIKGEGINKGSISIPDYERHMFKGYDNTFNDYDNYDPASLSVLIYPMQEAGNVLLAKKLSYLTSHLSNNDGIVRFATRYMEEPTAFVFFDGKQTSLKEVQTLIASPMMTVSFSDGTVKEVENPYKSKPEGVVKNASELSIGENE